MTYARDTLRDLTSPWFTSPWFTSPRFSAIGSTNWLHHDVIDQVFASERTGQEIASRGGLVA